MENDPLTEKIIGCCYEVHNELGPGFNEKIYQRALKIALGKKDIKHEEEKIFKVYFNEASVGTLKLDLLVEDKVVVELKASTGIMPKIFSQQIIAYLKATCLQVGLLINFGNKSCEVKRFVNGLR